jgi:hypothetical protein
LAFRYLFTFPEAVIISIILIKALLPSIIYILQYSIRQSIDFSAPIFKTAVGSALGLRFYDWWQDRVSTSDE